MFGKNYNIFFDERIFNLKQKIELRERCKGVHSVDLGESFPTQILLQNLASIQLITSLVNFARSPRTDPPGPAKPSILKALVSASINFILMFGLCCVYGIIMFDGPYAQHQALGVKMNLASAMIAARFFLTPG